jgi:hypothetical protein
MTYLLSIPFQPANANRFSRLVIFRALTALIFILVGLGLLAGPARSQDRPQQSLEDRVADEHEWMLQSEEMRSRITGVGENGVPKLCGTRKEDLRPSTSQSYRLRKEEEEFAAYELVPGVVPADGSESFYVRVRVSTDGVKQPYIKLDNESFSAIEAPEGESRDKVLLRDDGEGNDAAAGDSVYASKSMSVDTTDALVTPPYDDFRNESLFSDDFRVFLEKTNGTEEVFLIRPNLLIMESGIHDPGPINATDSIQVSDHIVNLKGGFTVQKRMRFLPTDQTDYAQRIYDHVVDDEYDFISYMSSNHVEIFPNPTEKSRNFISGLYTGSQVDGRSQTENLLDVLGRGLETNNTTHEILHEWSAPPIPDSWGLTRGAHYEPESSVKSLLGGVKWTENEDGNYKINCNLGRGGAYTASLLDLYLMGLIEGSEVDTLWAVADGSFPDYCTEGFGGGDLVEPSEVKDTVSIENIQDEIGVPEPEPGRDYSILFVVESNGRLLTDLEMAFYNLLAQHYTSSTAEGGYMGDRNWNPVQPYFGHGTSWSSEVEAKPPLPVELVSLDGTTAGEKAVRLTWQTASEENSAGFEVQRKVEQSGWRQIGYVRSKAEGGTTTEVKSYQHVAEDLSVGTHQFRLKQVDLDGSTAIHGPISVDVQMQEALKLTAPAPNPVSSTATLSFAVKEKAGATVAVYDMLGRKAATLFDGRPTPGESTRLQFDASSLPSGSYIVRLQADGQTETQRMTVVR